MAHTAVPLNQLVFQRAAAIRNRPGATVWAKEEDLTAEIGPHRIVSLRAEPGKPGRANARGPS